MESDRIRGQTSLTVGFVNTLGNLLYAGSGIDAAIRNYNLPIIYIANVDMLYTRFKKIGRASCRERV